MTRKTEFSLPGISEDARITVSPSPMRMKWSRLAMRDSADIGSPCEPVQTSTIFSSGRSSSCLTSTISPAGTWR